MGRAAGVIEPRQADIGRSVVYRERRAGGKVAEGVITSFNDCFVFVQYADVGPAATLPEDLEWWQPEEAA